MKLQINDRGSWRHVANFSVVNEGSVRVHAAKLVAAMNERATLRILDENNKVHAYCKGPNYQWEERT